MTDSYPDERVECFYDGSIHQNLKVVVDKFNLHKLSSFYEIPLMYDNSGEVKYYPAAEHPEIVPAIMLPFAEHERLLSQSAISMNETGSLIISAYITYSTTNDFLAFTRLITNELNFYSNGDINNFLNETRELYGHYLDVWKMINPGSDILPNVLSGYINMVDFAADELFEDRKRYYHPN